MFCILECKIGDFIPLKIEFIVLLLLFNMIFQYNHRFMIMLQQINFLLELYFIEILLRIKESALADRLSKRLLFVELSMSTEQVLIRFSKLSRLNRVKVLFAK